MKSPEQVVAEWIDSINAHDADRLAETLADDFTWELGDSTTTGRDVSREAWMLWFEAFPDLRFEPVQTLSSEGTVVTRMVISGTHLGTLRFRGTRSMSAGLAATGRAIRLPSCAVHLVENGKIAKLWAYWDTATMSRQMGMIPGDPPT